MEGNPANVLSLDLGDPLYAEFVRRLLTGIAGGTERARDGAAAMVRMAQSLPAAERRLEVIVSGAFPPSLEADLIKEWLAVMGEIHVCNPARRSQ